MIGSVIEAESRKEILTQQIYDKGDFYGNTGYVVETDDFGSSQKRGTSIMYNRLERIKELHKRLDMVIIENLIYGKMKAASDRLRQVIIEKQAIDAGR